MHWRIKYFLRLKFSQALPVHHGHFLFYSNFLWPFQTVSQLKVERVQNPKTYPICLVTQTQIMVLKRQRWKFIKKKFISKNRSLSLVLHNWRRNSISLSLLQGEMLDSHADIHTHIFSNSDWLKSNEIKIQFWSKELSSISLKMEHNKKHKTVLRQN